MKPSAILSSDWHIRSTTPVCRLDNFLQAQETKVKFIVELAKKYDCPILIAGDIGNKPEWPNWLLEWFISIVSDVVVIGIPGQHDLPDHKLSQIPKSGTGVLSISDVIDLRKSTFVTIENGFNLITFPFSLPIRHFKIDREKGNYPKVAMSHQMVIKKNPLWKGQKDPRGVQVLKKYPEFDLILTGDNHNSFVSKYKGRLLVNPGSLMRLEADQVNHLPRVYLWYAKINKIKIVYLPIEQGVVSRQHIKEKEEQETRIDTYITHMKTSHKVGLSFENNLRRRIKLDKISKRVETRIWENVT